MTPFAGEPGWDPIGRELEHHIQERTDELVARGWPPEEARQEAEARFGDRARVEAELEGIEAERDLADRAGEWLRAVAGDLRQAVRSLGKEPGFTLAVVLTLSLGAGASTAIFSVADAVLLRPLDYAGAERWMEVLRRTEDRTVRGQDAETFQAWSEVGSEVVDGWIGWIRRTHTRTDGIAGRPVSAVAVTPGAQALLGAPLLAGRGFTAEDALPGAQAVTILTRSYYERLGGTGDLLGSTLRLESEPVVVVGVLRGGVKFPDYGPVPDLWLPVRDDRTVLGRPVRDLQGVWARIRPDVSPEQANERLRRIAEGLEAERPREGGWDIVLRPLGQLRGTDELRRGLGMLAGTVALLLLIAVVNGVNLLLVRATRRTGEFAVRQALGGSRLRLGRQLLAEGLVLGLMGALGAMALAWIGVSALHGRLPGSLLFFSPHEVALEGRAAAFSLALALVGGVALGLVPGVELLRGWSTLRSRARRGDRPSLRRTRRILVGGQLAVSALLLFGTGLFLRSLSTLTAEDPGIDTERLVIAELELADERYSSVQRSEWLGELRRRLRAEPGVADAAYDAPAFSFGSRIEAEGGRTPEDQPTLVPHHEVSAGWERTAGADLVAGRTLDDGDRGSNRVVVDVDLANFLWGEGEAVGRRFRYGEDRPWLEVVGVVDQLRLMGRDQRAGPHQILVPTGDGWSSSFVRLLVRTNEPPERLVPTVRRALGALDPLAPVHSLRTGRELLAEQEAEARFLTLLMTLLSAAAAVLATVGLYGVLAYSVRRRTRELGIRMALGAEAGSVLAMVVRDGLLLALVGVTVGLGIALPLAGIVRESLYGVGPRDPLAALGAAGLLTAVALAASFVPAREATRVDPGEALRVD